MSVKRHPLYGVIIVSIAIFASGIAIAVTLLFEIRLATTLPLLVGVCLALIMFQYRSFPALARTNLLSVVSSGALIGLWATLAYDGSRYILVTLFDINFWPFKTFPLFGYSLLGPNVSIIQAWTAGIIYHILNGVTFAIAYCVILGGHKWLYGIVWAFALEIIMFSLYPGWLDTEAVMIEFTLVSCFGHFAYGTTLGILSQRRQCANSLLTSLQANEVSMYEVTKEKR